MEEPVKKSEKTKAIILLLVLIAIGGIVMYGGKTPPSQSYKSTKIPNESRR